MSQRIVPPPLRIVAIAPFYWPVTGGAERLLGSILEGLVHRGHAATVVTTDAATLTDAFSPHHTALSAFDVHNGVSIRRVAAQGGILTRSLRWMAQQRPSRMLVDRLSQHQRERYLGRPSAAGFLRALPQLRPDVVLTVNWAFPPAVFGSALAAQRGIPVVAIPLLHIARPWARREVLRSVMPQCAHTVGMTQSETAHHRTLGARRTSVIGGSIDATWGTTADGSALRGSLGLGTRPVIGFVGRQDSLKGTPTVITAMRIVWQRRPDAMLMLAGPAAHRDAATKWTLRALSHEERERVVEVHDFSDAQAPDLFAACDILAQPSVEESFGLVLLEAWMARRPVIGADIPATRDVIADGVDGLIVPPENPLALATAIQSLLDDPERRERLAEQGRAKVLREYTTQAMHQAWSTLLHDVVAEHRLRRQR
jgi:glycosyltransferase involved in cell wall biosynthesis